MPHRPGPPHQRPMADIDAFLGPAAPFGFVAADDVADQSAGFCLRLPLMVK